MRRYFKFLTTSLIACVLTIACVNELDLHQPINESEFYTTLVPRVEGFANQYITKSSYETYEQKITKLSILVFNEDGKCIHLQESENGGPITLNKSMLNSPEQSGKLDQATVVMIANIGTDKIVNGEKTIKDSWSSLTFSDLENYSFQYDDAQTIITSLGDGFIGFPMIGASKVDLTSTKQQQAAIEVKLKILYAKIKFAISVENGTENEGSGMSFQLSNYSVFNASKQTKLAVPTNQGEPTMSFEEFLLGQPVSESAQTATVSSATESASYAYNNPGKLGSAAGSVSVGGNSISFTFYVSESRFNHGLDIEQLAGIYPYGWTTTSEAEDVKDYTEEDKNKLNGVKYFYDELAQQYKPLLAQSASGEPAPGLATYVLLNGSYKDYRGEIWNVNYKVYLGKDNSQNFQVDRNSCYTNNIVIKGIRNNDDTDAHGEVWIDHRVDVEIGDANSAADHITITRETLIDSHIEVRPLRVRWSENEFAGVRIYFPANSDNSLVNWIGMERFTGDNNLESSTYCYNNLGESTGKRRYFTSSLISELQTKGGELGVHTDGNRKFIYLENGECAWIYFDENATTVERSASIVLDFYNAEGSVKATETYNVTQKGLLSLGDYYVESYEEYLHSYDSEDKYNLSTSPVDYTQQGLSWGLEGEYISKDIVVSAGPRSSWILFQGSVNQWYDYFHRQDQPSNDTYYLSTKNENGDWADATAGTGLIFTDRASYNEVITVKDMGTIPDNAYQYCLSKNKFAVDEDDKVTMKVHWYLPDAYEMRAILQGSGNSSDFDTEANYWSSQPSYTLPVIQNIGFVGEVPESARAVSSSGEISDKPRKEKHRIRCIYSPTGVTANMDGRTPDGVGGNYSFIMKGYNGSAAGYFNYMLSEKTTKSDGSPDDEFDYTNETYPYPTFSNPGTEFEYYNSIESTDGSSVSGFLKNPADQNNWSKYVPSDLVGGFQGHYYTLAIFPGLSDKTLEKALLDEAYKPTNTPKEDKKIEETLITGSLSKTLPSVTLEELDHQKGGDMFKISFSNEINSSHSPQYSFKEYTEGSIRKTTINRWRVPRYPEYTTKPASDNAEITGTWTGTATGYSYIWDNTYDEASDESKKNALANARADAIGQAKTEYRGRLLYEIVNENLNIVTKYVSGDWGVRNYTTTITGTITVKCTSSGVYYGNAENGGWYQYDQITEDLHEIITDELRIYCGNSFTIRLADQYKNDYEITRVRVHFSDDNFVGKQGGFLGYGEDEIYARFVD
ncbi:MAG: DUF4906 domain-containing protein, partial [Bacteroidales bacterium]|nr:DUF4906 domain-containing protein [Bacteroidales bacterium]